MSVYKSHFFLKKQLQGFSNWIKLKRKSLAGGKVDSAKLAKIEKELAQQFQIGISLSDLWFVRRRQK